MNRKSLWSDFAVLGLPPTLTVVVFGALYSSFGTGNFLDATTWPLKWGEPEKTATLDLAVYRLCVVTTAVLLFLNNVLIYMHETRRAAERANPNMRVGESLRSSAFWFSFASTLVVIAWILDALVSFVDAELRKNELIGIVLFALFASIDLLLSRNAAKQERLEHDSVQRERHRAAKDYYVGQVLFTDLPVVGGMAVLLLLTWMMSNSVQLQPSFDHGLSTGGVAMHVAYSQVVFLGLTYRYRLELRELDDLARAARACGDN